MSLPRWQNADIPKIWSGMRCQHVPPWTTVAVVRLGNGTPLPRRAGMLLLSYVECRHCSTLVWNAVSIRSYHPDNRAKGIGIPLPRRTKCWRIRLAYITQQTLLTFQNTPRRRTVQLAYTMNDELQNLEVIKELCRNLSLCWTRRHS